MVTVTIKPDGRVLIPARLRAELEAAPGEALVARVEGGRLILEKRAEVISRLQERFAHAQPRVSLVDELLADRRAEVERER
jgi:AbrB family looped-hinge helix DNA binding protein